MERGIAQIGTVVNGIVSFVQGGGQRLEIAEVERRLLSMVMEVGRAALEEFVAVKGTG